MARRQVSLISLINRNRTALPVVEASACLPESGFSCSLESEPSVSSSESGPSALANSLERVPITEPMPEFGPPEVEAGRSETESYAATTSLLEVAVSRSRALSQEEKYSLLTNRDLCSVTSPIERGTKKRKLSFQKKWIDRHIWLQYGTCAGNSGGWCTPCILFLSEDEKSALGQFVTTPFSSYYKSKEMFERHSNKMYHKKAMERAYCFKATFKNSVQRIDVRMFAVSEANYILNSKLLPMIVDAVCTCARQKVALQGHLQDKIDFSCPPHKNEGNFIAMMRLLAKYDSDLERHLVSGPKNAKYVSKTIQNELLSIASDQIRNFYKKCLKNSCHFSVMADEVSSHGQEILAVCLRFLEIDNSNFSVKPTKHEVLLDLAFLTRITGESIAKTIIEVLQKHKINIQDCKGQAYDTTASMSSSRTGVQFHIKEKAPYATYQGCCLHSLNLVICKSTQITSVRNMFDSCQQAFLYFHNSNKRQRFLEKVIHEFAPESKKTKINGLCKTRWVERHDTFSTIFELYPYLVKTWNEICMPSNCPELYSESSTWNWDAESRSVANGLKHTFTSFEHIVAFTLSKDFLEPMKPLAESLQGRLNEVYFGFKKVDEVTKFYSQLRSNVEREHKKVYTKALKLGEEVGSEESMPRITSGRQRRDNPTVTCPEQYWRVTITIPMLDSIITELEVRFSADKRAHYELCGLMPEVMKKNNDLETLKNVLTSKWCDLLPSCDNFGMELQRWKNHCSSISHDKSITHILAEDADPIFFPNIRELLCILAVLPIGSTEAERSFSCLRQLHTWLRSTMTEEQLGNLAVIAIHGFKYPIDNLAVCETFKRLNPRKMTSSNFVCSSE